jgi:hypothetical protein
MSTVDGMVCDYASELDKKFLEHKLLGANPRDSDSVGLGWAQEFAFLTSFQVILCCWVRYHIWELLIFRVQSAHTYTTEPITAGIQKVYEWENKRGLWK